jgi:hypothetical protein
MILRQSNWQTIESDWQNFRPRSKIEVEDPIKRNQIGAALFGSMWEDMGESVILAMDPAEAALLAFEGATGKAQEAVSGGLGGAWERLQRVLQVVLADGFAPVLAMLVENITPAFEAFGLRGFCHLAQGRRAGGVGALRQADHR